MIYISSVMIACLPRGAYFGIGAVAVEVEADVARHRFAGMAVVGLTDIAVNAGGERVPIAG